MMMIWFVFFPINKKKKNEKVTVTGIRT